MRYDLTKDKIKQAKQILKTLSNKIEMWEEEKEKAELSLKKSPIKYSQNIRKRINFAKEQVKDYSEKKNKIEDAIKKGFVEV